MTIIVRIPPSVGQFAGGFDGRRGTDSSIDKPWTSLGATPEMSYTTRVSVILSLVIASWGSAQEAKKARRKAMPPERPTPTAADVAYGADSDRQRLDLWIAKADQPTPLVVFIHGGGWMAGDKTGYGTKDFKPFLSQGISVAAINYRFIPQAMEQNVVPPVKACVHDAARAIQFLRSKSNEWSLDPTRVAATGSSAGACTSLWLALHDDLADPKASDPIARQSSRLTCAAVLGAQTSLDPEELRAWIPNAVYGGHAFGFAGKGKSRAKEFDELLAHRADVLPWIREYSPIELVSKDDPPIYLAFPNQKTPPVIGQPEPDPTHSALYGIKLAEKLKAAGVEAVVSYPGHADEQYRSPTEFMIAKLRVR